MDIARAVQRNFTNTANIKTAIEVCGLREFAEDNVLYSQTQFDNLHKEWVAKLKAAFAGLSITISYGRTAKIIAIYLKTAAVFCSRGECAKSKIIHPPIDSILLNNLEKNAAIKGLKIIKWTNIEDVDYWWLVKTIRDYFNNFNWTLEAYWTPEREVV